MAYTQLQENYLRSIGKLPKQEPIPSREALFASIDSIGKAKSFSGQPIRKKKKNLPAPVLAELTQRKSSSQASPRKRAAQTVDSVVVGGEARESARTHSVPTKPARNVKDEPDSRGGQSSSDVKDAPLTKAQERKKRWREKNKEALKESQKILMRERREAERLAKKEKE